MATTRLLLLLPLLLLMLGVTAAFHMSPLTQQNQDESQVTQNAPCTWSTNKDLPAVQALYINPASTRRDIRGFWLPQSGDIVTVPVNGKVRFACPGGKLNLINTMEATLSCVGGNTFKDTAGKNFNFTTLGCSIMPVTTAKFSGKVCPISGGHKHIEIGFSLTNNDFYTIIETCFNNATKDALYSVFLLTKEIIGAQMGSRPGAFMEGTGFYPVGMKVNELYKQENQTNAVEKAVGDRNLALQYVRPNSNYFMSRGHLTASSDFIYGSFKVTTFYFVNVAPQWQTVNGQNWNTLEDNVRTYAKTYPNDLQVYTGTHDVTTLAHKNGTQVPIYLTANNVVSMLKCPFFYWKVLYDPITSKGVAFVGLNNPHLVNPGKEFYLCPNECAQIKWLKWFPNDQVKGYSYCCEVNKLSPFVSEIPPLTIKGLLT